jgi:branched-chain amino acid transport system ATP-binding protein
MGAGQEAQVRAGRGRQPHGARHSPGRQAPAARLSDDIRPVTGAGPVLTLEGVSKSFGAVRAADGVTLSVGAGEVLGVIGPNGAGKTTVFNLIGGDVGPDAGTIRFLGEDITGLPPHQRCRRGIGRSYQIPHPFGGMTVFENLLVAATFGGRLREQAAYPGCLELLESTGLAARANRLAGSLALLDRKRLELARALATRPALLLLDEIAGGLTEAESAELVALIQRIKARGVAMIWIEHVVHALVAVADRLLVMNSGATLAEGPPAAVMADREVQRIYLGIEA